MQQWLRLYFQLPVFLRLLGTVLLFMVFYGVVIHTIEPGTFTTVFDGIWWAFITGATVGYGDYVPLTTAGRIITILLILTGGGLITFYMATLSAATVQHERDLSRGRVQYKGKHHIVIIGWNERTRQLIDMMEKNNSEEYIVLIDRSMKRLYENHSNVHFVHGDATMEETMEKANLKEAKTAIITADPSKAEHSADQSVIHQTVALKGHHPSLFIIAEVLTDKQKINAERAGANTVIRSNDFMSSLLYHELYHTDPVEPFQLLLELLTSRQFHEESVPLVLKDQSMKEAVIHYLEQGSVIVGYRQNKKLHFVVDHLIPLEKVQTLILLIPLRT
ncbi:potassium channel family protein [Halobacillus campisalis]|uniref:Potassium channel family protein n=1 Tax=Halobacillus campisalis TaxID=435909 RepID=A0ABW2K7J4_9BACI|nr:potassium channel family protein [Halobacillus campisalis]